MRRARTAPLPARPAAWLRPLVRRRARGAIAALWVVLASGAPARAAGREPLEPGATAALGAASPYHVDWVRDWTASAGALAVSLVLDAAVSPALGGAPACRPPADGRTGCAPASLWRLDRASLRHQNAGWRRASDVLQPTAIALGAAAAAALAAWDAGAVGPGRAVLTDLTVTTQAVAAATFAATVLKYAVRRPRPEAYRTLGGGGPQRLLSFPSGHTTAVAAASFAWATTVALRRPRPAVTAWALGAATALTAAVAAGRVLGGRHFPSDVVAGAVLGAACGVGVPLGHRLVLRAGPLGLHVVLGP